MAYNREPFDIPGIGDEPRRSMDVLYKQAGMDATKVPKIVGSFKVSMGRKGSQVMKYVEVDYWDLVFTACHPFAGEATHPAGN